MYAKILEDGTLEYAPRNKGSKSNYNTNIPLMLADGYLPVKEVVVEEGYYISGYIVEDAEIVPVIEAIVYTKEEIEAQRKQAYTDEVDPITAHIQRLRDEEQTAEIIAEIDALIAERAAKVAEIKERFPYPEEITPIDSENNSLEVENELEEITPSEDLGAVEEEKAAVEEVAAANAEQQEE